MAVPVAFAFITAGHVVFYPLLESLLEDAFSTPHRTTGSGYAVALACTSAMIFGFGVFVQGMSAATMEVPFAEGDTWAYGVGTLAYLSIWGQIVVKYTMEAGS